MVDQREFAIVRWPCPALPGEEGLAALLAAYHFHTEAEKGKSVADASALPERYRAEISNPRTAFVNDAVSVALSGGAAVGCVVVTAAAGRRSEIKRLWTDPRFRGRGIASGLLETALAHAADSGAATVRLSVWEWRSGAVALYERFGFTITDSWDERDQLICMERAI